MAQSAQNGQHSGHSGPVTVNMELCALQSVGPSLFAWVLFISVITMLGNVFLHSFVFHIYKMYLLKVHR